MNPLAETVKDTQFAPMSEVSKTLQIRWYRCPVDKKTLRDLMQPSDVRGLLQALGHLGLWLVTGGLCFVFFLQQAWIALAIALFAHGTVAAFFTAPHHELCHGTVFKSKRLNCFFCGFIRCLAGTILRSTSSAIIFIIALPCIQKATGKR